MIWYFYPYTYDLITQQPTGQLQQLRYGLASSLNDNWYHNKNHAKPTEIEEDVMQSILLRKL